MSVLSRHKCVQKMVREQKVLQISDRRSRVLSFENLLFKEKDRDIFYTENSTEEPPENLLEMPESPPAKKWENQSRNLLTLKKSKTEV